MPIMTRMRDSMPAILFGLLVAFLITIIFEWGMDYLGIQSGQPDVVGKVNGKTITFKDFSEVLKTYSDNQKAQTGVEPDDNAMKQAREQVWENFVTQQVLQDEIRRIGIGVADQELIDWVRGDTPPEDLRRNFVDSAGQFRKDLYDQFLSNPNQFIRDPEGVDAEYGTKWLAEYEKNLRQRRSQEKLQSLVLASVRVSEGELRHRFTDQNQRLEAVYALLEPNALVKDDSVRITEAGLKKYYEENLEQFKFEATRTLKYVQFVEKAIARDTLDRKNDIDDAASKAQSGLDFIELVFTYSDKPDSGAYFKHGELSSVLENRVFAAKVGEIVGPILDHDGFHLLKVLDERRSDNEFVHASHILFSLSEGDSNAVKTTARRVARDAKRGEDFSRLALEHSKDPGSAQRGGDLGWFGKGRMVTPFEEAAFKARPGEVVGPIRTQFGLHVIKVHAREAREVKVADIHIPVEPSQQTKNEIFERARDFAYNARQSDFVKEAQSIGFEAKETQVQAKGSVIPGIGVNESVARWAFNESVGAVSEPFRVANGYAVFGLAGVKDAGVKPFDDVKETVRPGALRRAKLEKAKARASELRAKLAPGDSLTKVSELDPSVKVQRTGPFTLAASVPGLGRDLSFMGAVSALSPGQVSPPVEGLRGVYLIQLVSRTEFDSAAYTAQRDVLRAQILQDKRSRFLADWLAKLKENADIEDNRDIFFR